MERRSYGRRSAERPRAEQRYGERPRAEQRYDEPTGRHAHRDDPPPARYGAPTERMRAVRAPLAEPVEPPPFEPPFTPAFDAPFEPPFKPPFNPPFEAPFEPPFEAGRRAERTQPRRARSGLAPPVVAAPLTPAPPVVEMPLTPAPSLAPPMPTSPPAPPPPRALATPPAGMPATPPRVLATPPARTLATPPPAPAPAPPRWSRPRPSGPVPAVDPIVPSRREPPSRIPEPPAGRHPERDRSRNHPRARLWTVVFATVGALVALGVCGLGTYFVVSDEKNGPADARASVSPSAKTRDIASRDVDPAPLTEAEVYPSPQIVAAANEPPYVVLKTQQSADCKVAATDALAGLLTQSGCSQVVRGTIKSPNGQYLITAGIFNLKDEGAANQAHESIKSLIDGQKGRFTGLLAGAGTDAIIRAPTHLGWNVQGHFLAYCVIARADSKAFDPNDGFPQQIIFDIVETHLRNDVIGARATVKASNPPVSAGPSAGG
jgi:hypothetical protein